MQHITSPVSCVNGNSGRMNFVSYPRRFYIEDILASDFGHRCPAEYKSVGSELDKNEPVAADTAAADPGEHPNIADLTISLSSAAAYELNKSIDAMARPKTTSSLSPSFHATTSSSSSCDGGGSEFDGRTSLKEDVKVEPYSSTNTDMTDIDDRSSTCCDVTSSTLSDLQQKTGSTTDGKDLFTLPAWVYCTRYSDRPSAGNECLEYLIYLIKY